MPKLYPEAFAFCLFWAGLAVAGFSLLGLKAGLVLSIGLLVVIMPSSALILSRTGNFALERGVRWGILALAGIGLGIWVNMA
jgi:hypothetical protein